MFNWNDFLVVAEHLSVLSDEGSKRSAISRAYYCAYHHALLLLASSGVEISARGSFHQNTWDALRNQGGTRETIGRQGNKLRKLRNLADYSAAAARLPNKTATALASAKEIVRLIHIEMRKRT